MRNEFTPFDDKKESSDKKEGKDSRREEKAWVPPPPLISPEGLIKPPTFESLEKDDDDEEDEDEGATRKKEKAEDSEEQNPESTQSKDLEQSDVEPITEDAESELPVASDAAETEAEMIAEPASEDVESPTVEFEDSGVLRIDRESEQARHEFSVPESAEEPAPPPPAAAGSTPPPRPPVFPPGETAPFDRPQEPEPEAPTARSMFSRSWNSAPAPFVTAEQHRAELRDTRQEAEKRGLRRGLVAGFITGYILKAYLANRKQERYEKAVSKQLNERDEQITSLQREQQSLGEQLKVRAEEYRQRQEQLSNKYKQTSLEKPASKPAVEALPPVKTAESEPIFDQEGNEIILKPGWRVERSTGGYSVVLDEHNRVVHNAIHYGEAYLRDQKREQLNNDLFASVGGAAPVGGPDDSGFGPIPAAPGQLPGAQYAPPPSQQPTVDLKHRLPKPRNQVVATVASPWLWTAVAILIIVYFIAALA